MKQIALIATLFFSSCHAAENFDDNVSITSDYGTLGIVLKVQPLLSPLDKIFDHATIMVENTGSGCIHATYSLHEKDDTPFHFITKIGSSAFLDLKTNCIRYRMFSLNYEPIMSEDEFYEAVQQQMRNAIELFERHNNPGIDTKG